MSKIKNGGLNQYGAEPFEQQQFKTADVEGVNVLSIAQCASANIIPVLYICEGSIKSELHRGDRYL